LKLLTENPGPTQVVAAIAKKANDFLWQVSTTPARAALNWLNWMVLV